MNEDRRAVLQMLADGKVNADEAERLISALERNGFEPPPGRQTPDGQPRTPKYLRVVVNAQEAHEGKPTKVNIRVPLALLRAGVRLSSIIPPTARDHLNAEMAKKGVAFDLNQLKPENLEDLIEQLNELTVDVDQEQTTVRIYCE
jgi:hypothetical protein